MRILILLTILGLNKAISPIRVAQKLTESGIEINGKSIEDTFNFSKNLDEKRKFKRAHDSINLARHPLLNEDDDDVKNDTNKTGPGSLEWATGLASGLVITLCSVCGVLLIPITGKPWYKKLLLYLIATATSSLMGNSLFQLFPPAFGVDMSDPANIGKSVVCYVSFMFFFIIERILNIVFGENDDEEDDGKRTRAGTMASRLSLQPDGHARNRAGSTVAALASAAALHADELKGATTTDPNLTLVERMKQVKMVAWMLFIGDALENVADGLAMGAGFGSSIALGIGITIAIFSEEFPHKIGDFAIFLNAGMDTKMALIVNVISGATVWIGIVIGLLLGENEEATRYIFAIAAGVFLYVGLGGLFPEMGETSEELIEEGESPWLTLTIELAGLCTGLAMMILLCLFSDDIEAALT